MTDLLALTAQLVAVPSLSRQEAALADVVERELRRPSWLRVDRVGDNVVARTQRGRPTRVIVAGHLDTVPGETRWRLEGDTVHGLGAADMKSALAVHLDLALTMRSPAVDVTWVFYAREEVAAAESGLLELFELRPDLLEGDVAVCGEPTDGWVEAGCQGSLRIEVELQGARAHTARPWTGRNAVHRLGRLLSVVDGWPERRPVLDGCEYREALQAVAVAGGTAGNVVPDRATLTLNHRVAPDRTLEQALASLWDAFGPLLEDGDRWEVTDRSDPAPPSLGHPVLAGLVARNDLQVRAKLGWTDVARFAAHGIPACNLGPGDPELAHTADERVTRAAVERYHAVLTDLLTTPA